MRFIPETEPFPYWDGPYSPSRGNSGFRIKNGNLGAWVNTEEGREFCSVHVDEGVQSITKLVQRHWRGGRLLFLPTGLIVKPLQEEHEAGVRVVIGRYEGGLAMSTDSGLVDFSSNTFIAGSEWPGPSTVGLECTISPNGSLQTFWQQPSDFGQEQYRESITGTNSSLIAGFKKGRPYDAGGRVRVTIGGHVITNRRQGDGWQAVYVGKLDRAEFDNWDKWIQRR